MHHIFCEDKTKAQERLDKLYSAYSYNPDAILNLLDECVMKCKRCFEHYLQCKLNMEIEKERICVNFTPEKIYNWEWLFDKKILGEYTACKNYPSAYTGFKGVAYLILQKIKSNEIWKKIDLETISFSKDEAKALFGAQFERSIAYIKALIKLQPLFDSDQFEESMRVLAEIYTKDQKECSDLTEIRLEIIKGLSDIYGQNKDNLLSDSAFSNLLPMMLEDLLKQHRVDLIIKNLEMFENSGFDPVCILKEIQDFNTASFMFLLKNIESINFHDFIQIGNVGGLLDFIHRGDALKESKYHRNQHEVQLVVLFRELALWIVKNIEKLDVLVIEKLISIDFSVFGDSAYYLLFVNAFTNLKIPRLPNIVSNVKAVILNHIQRTDRVRPEIFDQSAVSKFIDDVVLFKPYLNTLDDFANRFLSRVRLNYSTALQSIKTFGKTRQFLRKIIENLIFEGYGLENIMIILRLEASDLTKLLINMAKSSNIDKETMCVLRKYGVELDKSDDEELLIISSDSDVLQKESSTVGESLNCWQSQKVVFNQQTMKPAQKKEATISEIPRIIIKSEFANIKRKDGSKNTADKNLGIGNKIELDKLKKIAAKINVNNPEKEAVILDSSKPLKTNSANDTVKNTQSFSIASLITQKSMQAIASPVHNSQKSTSNVDIEGFFDECLSPLSPFSKSIISEIPASFSSYDEYYNLFNPLRKNENLASIRSSIFENAKYFECKVHSQQRLLRIRATKFKFEVYDMLYFSKGKTRFNFSDLKHLEAEFKSGSFLGIVVAIYPEEFPVDFMYNDLVEIRILPGIKLDINQNLFYKYNGNIVSSMREFNALTTLKESKILKYVLRPSFLQDFLERKIDWHDKKCVFTSTNNNMDYVKKETKNENEILFQKVLMNSHRLNQSQATAVSKSFFSKDKFILIQGPPGTGKTTTILSIISTFLLFPQSLSSVDAQIDIPSADQVIPNVKILVCAPSNTAIDVIAERLVKGIRNFKGNYTKVNFLRIGANTNPNIEQYTLEYLLNTSNNVSKHKPKQEILLNASVICSTLSSSVSEVLNIKTFDLIIIDEACQSTEISSIIPFKYDPNKIVLIGDPKQLPPTVISDQCQLKKSLFERLLSYYTPVFLDVQYRMHPEICQFSSSFFYDNKIQTSPDIIRKTRDSSGLLIPLNFINILKNSESVDGFKSFYNLYECKICVDICKAICEVYGRRLKIVILTPYKGQCTALMKNSFFEDNGIEVNTIDGFQGQECDVTIFSTVRQSGLGFTCDFRRINVAMTRARECVIVLGSKECLSKSKTWNKIINYFISNGRYTDSTDMDRFLVNLFSVRQPHNRKLNR